MRPPARRPEGRRRFCFICNAFEVTKNVVAFGNEMTGVGGVVCSTCIWEFADCLIENTLRDLSS